MKTEEILKSWTKRRPIDKRDREMPFFSWDAMIDFADYCCEEKGRKDAKKILMEYEESRRSPDVTELGRDIKEAYIDWWISNKFKDEKK